MKKIYNSNYPAFNYDDLIDVTNNCWIILRIISNVQNLQDGIKFFKSNGSSWDETTLPLYKSYDKDTYHVYEYCPQFYGKYNIKYNNQSILESLIDIDCVRLYEIEYFTE